ncbi:hypothetical protein AAF712_010427 [Marasmius tenuissimus]|uniref:Uncharacterized protein n=1 Tax=Marasmius tenuissimus TaxID=585030 RepID=A0ABR2ZM44_9AGAR
MGYVYHFLRSYPSSRSPTFVTRTLAIALTSHDKVNTNPLLIHQYPFTFALELLNAVQSGENGSVEAVIPGLGEGVDENQSDGDGDSGECSSLEEAHDNTFYWLLRGADQAHQNRAADGSGEFREPTPRKNDERSRDFICKAPTGVQQSEVLVVDGEMEGAAIEVKRSPEGFHHAIVKERAMLEANRSCTTKV